jgi:hypothetical protein
MPSRQGLVANEQRVAVAGRLIGSQRWRDGVLTFDWPELGLTVVALAALVAVALVPRDRRTRGMNVVLLASLVLVVFETVLGGALVAAVYFGGWID